MDNITISGRSPEFAAGIARLADLERRVLALEQAAAPEPTLDEPEPEPETEPPLGYSVRYFTRFRDGEWWPSSDDRDGGDTRPVLDPLGSGVECALFEGGSRAEFWHSDHITNDGGRLGDGVTYGYREDIMIPEDWLMSPDPAWHVLWQAHGGKGSPPLSLNIYSGDQGPTLDVVDHSDGDAFRRRWTAPVSEMVGKRFALTVLAEWSKTQGRVSVAINGVEVWYSEGERTVHDKASTVYTKGGHYSGRGASMRRYGYATAGIKSPTFDRRLHQVLLGLGEADLQEAG